LFEDGLYVLDMKLKGTFYDGMSDEEGNPLPKPDNDIGLKLMQARARRNRIIKMVAGKALPTIPGGRSCFVLSIIINTS